MTCDEFRDQTMDDPLRETVGERLQHKRHFLACAKCRRWLKKLAREAAKLMTPDDLKECKEVGDALLASDRIARALDPHTRRN